LQSVDTGGSPSWLTLHGDCLLATLTDTDNILSYHRNSSGHLALVSNITSVGFTPVDIDVFDSRGSGPSIVVAADYHGTAIKSPDGSGVTSLLLDRNCKLASGDFYPVTGHGPMKARQLTAHVHSVVRDISRPDSGLFFACDLGSDRVYTFKADLDTGKLGLKGNFSSEPGSGPRHVAVNPQRQVVYVLHEMANIVTVHDIKGEVGGAGWLKEVQRVPLMPEHYSGFSKAAEILLSPSYDAVFASNRGFGNNVTNTIVGFRVRSDGTLVPASRTPAPRCPRGMHFTPKDNFLLVAGQTSGSVVAMAVGHEGVVTGVTPLLREHDLATPTAVVIAADPMV